MPHRGILVSEHNLELVGLGITGMPQTSAAEATRRVMLIHYPVMADHLNQRPFDLILAGHSHGGQVRLPFFGAVSLPNGVGDYDYGRYETAGGTLYVNAGIGTLSHFPIRFNCPPEITVVTI
jgi:predicted MPP superfamily phosphohydrolase